MAERRGLSFGQLITLTFGFLLASVFIFVFGFWVGRDLAEQRTARARDVAHVPVAPPEPAPTQATVAAAPMRAPVAGALGTTLTPAHVAATATALSATPTATRARAAPASPTKAASAGAGWTVQAYATNDTVRAVMLARTLRSKGYDATTATRQVGGVTWYIVRVGHFRDRAAAKAMESKLRTEEGLEAASVAAQ